VAIVDEATIALRKIEPELQQPTKGGVNSLNLADRIRSVRKLLAKQETRWINTTKARRLLAATSPDTVETLIRIGFLRSRNRPGGRIQVILADVLGERQAREELLAIGGDDLTGEELEIMHQAQPGTNPWERDTTDSSR